ncbi:MAG: hypothetical protein WC810_23930 [Janthinobacterium sp.]|jgi:hypothetical protein
MKEETKLKIGKSKERCSDERAIEIFNECIRLKQEPYGIPYKTTLRRFGKDWTRLKLRIAHLTKTSAV